MGSISRSTKSDCITLQLPYPPSVNQYYRKFRNIMVISAAGRKFQKEVRESVGSVATQTGRLRVEIEVHAPDRRKRDIDNVCKATLDALTKSGVYNDDSQIDVLIVIRRSVVPGGCLIVKVSEVKVKKQSESKQRKASKIKENLDLRRTRSRKVDPGESVPKSGIPQPRRRNSRS